MKTAHRSHAAGRSDASAPGVRDGHDRTAVPMMFRGGVLAALALLPIAAVVGLVARGTAGLLGAVAAAIVWVGGQVWGFMASRTPMFDVALPGGTR